jgi:alkylation response protein AidB-like acyl-CoA dehydrogenase
MLQMKLLQRAAAADLRVGKGTKMNFDFSEEERRFHLELENTLAGFVAEENLSQGTSGITVEIVRKCLHILSVNGYLNLGLEEPDAAQGGSLNLIACMEILATASQSLYLATEMSTRMFGRIIHTWGTREQKMQLLPLLKTGEILGAVALSEETMNVHNDPLATEGIEKGEDVQVSGIKNFVVNGPVADWIAVVGRMRDQEAIFLVERGSPGLLIHEPLSTLGYEDIPISGLRLACCRVLRGKIIQAPEETRVIEKLRQWENQILMGASLGMMKSAFESAKKFANMHRTGGKPIIAYQEVAFKLAEMLALYQTSQLLAFRAAWSSDMIEREGGSLTLCAKVFCTESAEKVASQALQILSGTGYQTGNKAESAYRCAKYAQIAGTSTEIARVVIGDEVLGYR